MLLVQKDRAGSHKLHLYFQEQVNRLQRNREIIKDKIQVKSEISFEDQIRYYSSWCYAAVHIGTSLPQIQTPPDLAALLKLPLEKIKTILDFLLHCGLVENHEEQLTIGANRIHLGTNSPLLAHHHRNWREHALHKIDRDLDKKIYTSLES